MRGRIGAGAYAIMARKPRTLASSFTYGYTGEACERRVGCIFENPRRAGGSVRGWPPELRDGVPRVVIWTEVLWCGANPSEGPGEVGYGGFIPMYVNAGTNVSGVDLPCVDELVWVRMPSWPGNPAPSWPRRSFTYGHTGGACERRVGWVFENSRCADGSVRDWPPGLRDGVPCMGIWTEMLWYGTNLIDGSGEVGHGGLTAMYVDAVGAGTNVSGVGPSCVGELVGARMPPWLEHPATWPRRSHTGAQAKHASVAPVGFSKSPDAPVGRCAIGPPSCATACRVWVYGQNCCGMGLVESGVQAKSGAGGSCQCM